MDCRALGMKAYLIPTWLQEWERENMTNQEKIREAIEARRDVLFYWHIPYCSSDDESFNCLMKRFKEIGLVFKVGEHPRHTGYFAVEEI